MTIEIYVNTDLEGALQALKREVGRSGITRLLRLRAIPKQSERRKVKAQVARKRRLSRERRRHHDDEN